MKSPFIVSTLSFALLSALSANAVANSFQNEVGLGLISSESDARDNNTKFIAGIHYLEAINPSDGTPLGEAAFLSKTSYVEGVYGPITLSAPNYPDVKAAILMVGVKYFVAENLALGLDISKVSFDSTSSTASSSVSNRTLSAAYFTSDTTLIKASFSAGDEKFGSAVDTAAFGLEVKTFINNVFSVYAGVENSTVEALEGDQETAENVLGGTYYISPQLGVGAEYSTKNEEGDNDSSEIEINSTLFFKNNTYLETFYSIKSADDSADDATSIGIAYNMRF